MVAMAALVDRYGFALVGLSAEEGRTRGVSCFPAGGEVALATTVTPACQDPSVGRVLIYVL
jgi:hypothetical protein